jgi:3-hydroxybutyryl-CoA dehydrogenase
MTPSLPPSRQSKLPIQTLAIIGAGPAGRSFALRCAAAGLDVFLEDVMPSNLRRAQDEYAELAVIKGAGTLHLVMTVEDAVQSADLAIDFVPDELESKLEIFSLLDRMAPPRTILCTPTRALSITDLASCTYRSGLCIGLRGKTVNLLQSPLQILRSRFADPAALTAVAKFLERVGIEAHIIDDVEEPMLVRNFAV